MALDKKTQPLHTDIILIDIVSYSLLPDEIQLATALIINDGLVEAVELTGLPIGRQDQPLVRGFVPTGDGFYVILEEGYSGLGILVALGLRNILLFKGRQFKTPYAGVRASVHHGSAIPFTDVTGRENYVGSGLNDCARLQSLPAELKEMGEVFSGDANWVNVSQECWKNTQKNPRFSVFQPTSLRISNDRVVRDKHGVAHNFYFIEISRQWVSGL